MEMERVLKREIIFSDEAGRSMSDKRPAPPKVEPTKTDSLQTPTLREKEPAVETGHAEDSPEEENLPARTSKEAKAELEQAKADCPPEDEPAPSSNEYEFIMKLQRQWSDLRDTRRRIFYDLAMAQVGIGHLEEALLTAKRGAAVNASWPDAWVCLAEVHNAMDNSALALEALDLGVLQKDPGNVIAGNCWRKTMRSKTKSLEEEVKSLRSARVEERDAAIGRAAGLALFVMLEKGKAVRGHHTIPARR